MGNNVKVVTATAEYNFENILGHQIGNGAVQIMKRDGDQTIIGGFEEIQISLDEENKAKFASDLYKAEHPPELPKAVNDAKMEKKDNVVGIASTKACDVEASDETTDVEKGSAKDKEPDDLLA